VPDEPYDPERCTACRGTGTVISGLGGTPKPVTCPWCDGTGRFMRDHDAQAGKRKD
jgi:DnaJ-class molecular chaperone